MSVQRVRYEENHASFGQFMMSEQALMPVMQVSRAIISTMRDFAPRSHDKRGQAYADSFVLKSKPGGVWAGKGKHRSKRIAATIANTADHAPAIEFGRDRAGWRQDPPQRVMLKAGLKFGDSGRGTMAAAAAGTLKSVRLRSSK